MKFHVGYFFSGRVMPAVARAWPVERVVHPRSVRTQDRLCAKPSSPSFGLSDVAYSAVTYDLPRV